jgi:hypothetical protein
MARKRKTALEDFSASFGVDARIPDPVTPLGGGNPHKGRPLDVQNSDEMEKIVDRGSELETLNLESRAGMTNEILRVMNNLKKEDISNLLKALKGLSEEDKPFEIKDADAKDEKKDKEKEVKKESILNRFREDTDMVDDGTNPDDTTTVDRKDRVAEEDEKKDKEKKINGTDDHEDLKVESLVMNYDVSKLFEGTDLSEDFRTRFTSMFESTVLATVTENLKKIDKKIRQEYKEDFDAAILDLNKHVGKYLEHVAEEYIKHNALAIDAGIKFEQAESFMTEMRKVFKEHYVSVPEEKVNYLDKMARKIDRLEEELGREIKEKIELVEFVKEMRKEKVLEQVSSEHKLASTTASKLKTLTESLDFISEEDFKSKVTGLAKTIGTSKTKEVLKETVNTKTYVSQSEKDAVEKEKVRKAFEIAFNGQM